MLGEYKVQTVAVMNRETARRYKCYFVCLPLVTTHEEQHLTEQLTVCLYLL